MNDRTFITADGVHPTEAEQQYIARKIVDAYEKTIVVENDIISDRRARYSGEQRY
jgi:phospholipase/lecithinase/hemolysin